MSRYLAFLVALLSVSVPRYDFLADGFFVVSGVQKTSTSTSASSWVVGDSRLNSRLCIGESGNSNAQGKRSRRTRLFSQTTRPTPWFCEEAPSKSAPTSKATTKTEKTTKKFNAARFAVTEGPDVATKPDYENIHGPLGKTLDKVFLWVFRTKLAEHVGVDSNLPKTDFNGLMELTAAMNARYSDRAEIQKIAQKTLNSMFPSWLPGQYAILFSKPFPEFSARMNAWATYMAGQWLMGECEINDVEIDGKIMKDQGLLVKRCRFLEESGCASVCVNSCKIPTQKFFIEDMGLPLTMTPDYETHECQFAFGRMPTPQDDLNAMGTPCLSRCPTAGSMRQWHNGGSNTGGVSKASPEAIGQCSLMENPSEGEETQLLTP